MSVGADILSFLGMSGAAFRSRSSRPLGSLARLLTASGAMAMPRLAWASWGESRDGIAFAGSKIDPNSIRRGIMNRLVSIVRRFVLAAGLVGLTSCVPGLWVTSEAADYGYYGEDYEDPSDIDNPGFDVSGIRTPDDWYVHVGLRRYGDWISIAGYGNVWRPLAVASWTPYSLGYWASSSDGMMWVSYEPFGYIVYHYGYWAYVHGYGWCWFPGTDWAPHHVWWLEQDDYVGWYPVPPPISVHIDIDLHPNWDSYVWVPRNRFMDRHIWQHRETRRPIQWRANHPNPPDPDRRDPSASNVERWIGRRVPQVSVEEIKRPTRRGDVNIRVPDQQTRQEVKRDGDKVVRRWLKPKPPAVKSPPPAKKDQKKKP
jgi:uncharacterized protein DUF6600